MRLAVDEATKIEDAIREAVAGADTLEQEHQNILGGGGDFASNLRVVTGVLPSGVDFTSMEIDTGQIMVGGKADNAFTVIRYVMALEAQERLPEVRIVEIAESNPEAKINGAGSTGVAFTIVINKKG